MKPILCIIISVLLSITASNGQSFTPPNPDSLISSNGIRSEFIYAYNLKKDKIVDSSLVILNLYDSLGSGKKILFITYDSKVKDSMTSIIGYSYEYDSNKRLKKLITNDRKRGSVFIVEYDYNAAGKIATTRSYSEFNKVFTKFTRNEYDENNKLLKVYEKTMENAEYSLKLVNNYNAIGWLRQTDNYDKDGLIESHYEYDYYNSGVLKRESFFVKGREGISIDYKYNDKKQLVQEQVLYRTGSMGIQQAMERNIGGIGTPIVENYIYYPEGLFYERNFWFKESRVIYRAFYSTFYPED